MGRNIHTPTSKAVSDIYTTIDPRVLYGDRERCPLRYPSKGQHPGYLPDHTNTHTHTQYSQPHSASIFLFPSIQSLLLQEATEDGPL